MLALAIVLCWGAGAALALALALPVCEAIGAGAVDACGLLLLGGIDVPNGITDAAGASGPAAGTVLGNG